MDTTRIARGALSGVAAAAAWAAQQPLDKRVFGCPYSDTELLGRAVVPHGRWQLPGVVLHLSNGALFGAVYAALAPSLPVPGRLRGPAAAMAEHLSTWPLVGVSDRVHPARDVLPSLKGSRRAFAQATWRHLLFGLVLGEVERRLNGPPPGEPELALADFSSNGHGSLEHAVSVQG